MRAASTDSSTACSTVEPPGRSIIMKGYVAKKGNQYYAVIYEGLDPVTGKEKRTWHPAGTDRKVAEALASKLAAEIDGANDTTRSLTTGGTHIHKTICRSSRACRTRLGLEAKQRRLVRLSCRQRRRTWPVR